MSYALKAPIKIVVNYVIQFNTEQSKSPLLYDCKNIKKNFVVLAKNELKMFLIKEEKEGDEILMLLWAMPVIVKGSLIVCYSSPLFLMLLKKLAISPQPMPAMAEKIKSRRWKNT